MLPKNRLDELRDHYRQLRQKRAVELGLPPTAYWTDIIRAKEGIEPPEWRKRWLEEQRALHDRGDGDSFAVN